jgi:hypothetical protein
LFSEHKINFPLPLWPSFGWFYFSDFSSDPCSPAKSQLAVRSSYAFEAELSGLQ